MYGLTWVLSCVVVVMLVETVSFSNASDLYRCPSRLPRTQYLKTFQGYCYWFVAVEQYWPAAQKDCQGNGGNLVAIFTRGIQNFLMRSFRQLKWNKNGVWIGATDVGSEMSWRWVNVGQMSEYHYNNWSSGQPSCGPILCREHCGLLRLSDSGLWHDYQCASASYHYTYVCQYKMKPATTMAPATTAITATTTDEPVTTEKTNTTAEFAPPALDRHRGSENVQAVKEKNNTGMIVGLILASIGSILIVAAIVFFVMRRRRNKNSRDQSLEEIGHSNPGYGESGLPVNSPGSRPVVYTRESESLSLPPDFDHQVNFLSQTSTLESPGAVGGPLPIPPTPTYKGKFLSDSDLSDSEEDGDDDDNEKNLKQMYARIPADAAAKGKANVSPESRPQDGASASGMDAHAEDNLYSPMGRKGKAKKKTQSKSPPTFRK